MTGGFMLDNEWFKKHDKIAQEKMRELGCAGGSMEIRFQALNLHEPARSRKSLLQAVKSSLIDTFGWPIGAVFSAPEDAPYPTNNGIASYLADRNSFDYWALSLKGEFYLRQHLYEDKQEDGRDKIFVYARIQRIAETLMFAQRVYGQLIPSEEVSINLKVAHHGLLNRRLKLPTEVLRHARPCQEDCSEIHVTEISLSSNLTAYVQYILKNLFEMFDFFEMDTAIYERVVTAFQGGEVLPS
jgi:hypothetical protein